ncbi:OsmC family protein [Solitalea canadensis]|uniref:Putative redox protein, regulator of disulfide bond formation n=1 Tax=Solitalea canadensis (strain ATCC 29591 / DSM 3403 / JCM 21819 / LMG 8368 / NBRC 15130 / NCIMB 12057 / USAM 9D) TaxID=929556 RepID=H8KUG3_SOLCM|nr:OsmC family protein [Solitalea canadensis]AFD07328.1 putative redox protein, regulator of disulfide bond formation [Solitalea canadensis DSM 3403]
MNIKLERKNNAYHFEAVNEQGNVVNIDANPSIGGENKGFRPMETLLAGLGGCSAIDVISILTKQKEPLKDLKISIDAKRVDGEIPSLFEVINVEYHFFGDLNTEKIERALALTYDKYCSVAQILGKTAKLSYTYKLN